MPGKQKTKPQSELLELADAAAHRAETATDAEMRGMWLQIAAQWRALAEQAERMKGY
jgi:hypothetical protein